MAVKTKAELDAMKVVELRALARELALTGTSGLRKAELVDAIVAAGEGGGAAAPAKKAPAKRAPAKKTAARKTAAKKKDADDVDDLEGIDLDEDHEVDERDLEESAGVEEEAEADDADMGKRDDKSDDPEEDAVKAESAVKAAGALVLSSKDDDDEAPVYSATITGATADPVKDYLKQIGKVPLLNAAEEVDLAMRIEAGLYAEDKLLREPNLPAKFTRELKWIMR